MEIKLAENSNLVVKNHSGDVLCSIDESTGNVTGGGTKLYRHKYTGTYEGINYNVSLITTKSTSMGAVFSDYPIIIDVNVSTINDKAVLAYDGSTGLFYIYGIGDTEIGYAPSPLGNLSETITAL